MKVGIITYDAPHRKTQDLISGLLMHGIRDIDLMAMPFVERKPVIPIFSHRPVVMYNLTPDDLAMTLGINSIQVTIETMPEIITAGEYDRVLIGGAGILSPEITALDIINTHPGYLPDIRGLDALKWAILKGEPIGVTTHFIGEEADSGRTIEQRFVPVYFEDTFHSLAQRHYETEISMLVNAAVCEITCTDPVDVAGIPVTRRMPHHLELVMIKRFEELRMSSPSKMQSGYL